MKPFNEKDPVNGVNMKESDYILHGDVIVSCLSKLPKDFSKMPIVKDSCLAYGELTGHMHKLVGGEFELREDVETKTRWLKVAEPTMLKHQEHRPVEIMPGNYRIGIQEEYDPFTKKMRSVAD